MWGNSCGLGEVTTAHLNNLSHLYVENFLETMLNFWLISASSLKFTVPAKMFTRKNLCKANGCFILVNMGNGGHVDIKCKSFNMPLIRFQLKNQNGL